MYEPITKLIELYAAPDAVPELVEVARYDDPRGFSLWCTYDGRICYFRYHKWRTYTYRIMQGYYEALVYSQWHLKVNRVVCAAWHGPCPHPGWQADHINRQRLDNRAQNLQWLSPEENRRRQRKQFSQAIYSIDVHLRGYADVLYHFTRPTDVDRLLGTKCYFKSAAKTHPYGRHIMTTRKYEIIYTKTARYANEHH